MRRERRVGTRSQPARSKRSRRLHRKTFMAIRWDKFTVKAQEAVQRANELASEHGNPELQPLHLLAALLEDKEGIVPPVLEKIGIGPQAVLSDVYRELEKLPKVSGQANQAALSSEASTMLEQAFKEAS